MNLSVSRIHSSYCRYFTWLLQVGPTYVDRLSISQYILCWGFVKIIELNCSWPPFSLQRHVVRPTENTGNCRSLLHKVNGHRQQENFRLYFWYVNDCQFPWLYEEIPQNDFRGENKDAYIIIDICGSSYHTRNEHSIGHFFQKSQCISRHLHIMII